MASEYLLKKAREEVKKEEPRVLTKEEKRRNWWYYYKWHVVIGGVLLLILLRLLAGALGIGQVEPDYTVAYVGSIPLSEETVEALVEELTVLSPDMNGDGKVTVGLQQYVTVNTGDSDTLYYAQAAQVKLVADITECVSYFFLLEDPAFFQEATSALCNLDGSLPAEGDLSPEGKCLPWGSCPALAQMELGADLSHLSFARRGFWTDKTVANAAECGQLWNILTEGALIP